MICSSFTKKGEIISVDKKVNYLKSHGLSLKGSSSVGGGFVLAVILADSRHSSRSLATETYPTLNSHAERQVS